MSYNSSLTDAQLRASVVPVSLASTTVTGSVAVTGTFWQATQPVSLASTTITGTVTTSVTGSVAVTGTFWQATQPISGTITANAGTGTFAISAASLPLPTGAATAAKQPALGTAGAASTDVITVQGIASGVAQPVSGTVTANAGTGTMAISAASLPLPTGAATETTLAALNTKVTAVNTGAVTISGALPTGANVIGGVTQSGTWNIGSITTLPALAAGTNLIGKVQPNMPLRVVRNFILNTFTAAPVADTMQLVEQWYNNAAVAATVSPAVVPAGKILRLTSWGVETKSLATVGSVVLRLRANVAGTAVIGSPLVATIAAGSQSGATTVAMTGGHSTLTQDFGQEGLEFAAGTGIGFSLAGYGPTGTLTLQGVTRFWAYGYEYTA